LIAAALAEGTSRLENLLVSEDTEATREVLEGFGVEIQGSHDAPTVKGRGMLSTPHGPLDCRESGSTVRFLIPLGGLVDGPVTFTGSPGLSVRPLSVYKALFDEKQIAYESGGELPFTLHGRLSPGTYAMTGDVSSQFITGLLFALPLLDGDSELVLTTELESADYVALTLEALDRFGIEIRRRGERTFIIPGNQAYRPRNIAADADYSQAAFFLVAGALGSDLKLSGLDRASAQADRRILEILSAAGIEVKGDGERMWASPGRPVGRRIDVSQCPDLVPILAVLGCFSEGETIIEGAARVRIKESDRLKAICTELNKLGARIEELPEGLVIQGVDRLRGGSVSGWNDHRIVMALAIAATRADGPVIIRGSEAVAKSYPTFFEDYATLGGDVRAREDA
jgi:3-phosphoshikimate 1-carboxyvinyltransferase